MELKGGETPAKVVSKKMFEIVVNSLCIISVVFDSDTSAHMRINNELNYLKYL